LAFKGSCSCSYCHSVAIVLSVCIYRLCSRAWNVSVTRLEIPERELGTWFLRGPNMIILLVIIVTVIKVESHSPREEETIFICELLYFISNLPYDDYIWGTCKPRLPTNYVYFIHVIFFILFFDKFIHVIFLWVLTFFNKATASTWCFLLLEYLWNRLKKSLSWIFYETAWKKIQYFICTNSSYICMCVNKNLISIFFQTYIPMMLCKRISCHIH